jgi:hypothetical protein
MDPAGAPVELYYRDSADDSSTDWIFSAAVGACLPADWFSCADEAGIDLTERYILSCHKALVRGVKIVRPEPLISLSTHWSDILRNTLDRYGENFELHFLKDTRIDLPARCFAIDPDGPECRAMIGLSDTERGTNPLSGTATSVPGTGGWPGLSAAGLTN